jgi:hypothetical protein
MQPFEAIEITRHVIQHIASVGGVHVLSAPRAAWQDRHVRISRIVNARSAAS